jgi:hypothetical protein
VTQAEQATKRADLGQTRERLREVALRFPGLDAAVRAAAGDVERLKLEADLRPKDRHARELAEHAGQMLDTAILERDAVTESIERLRRHEAALAAELAAVAETGRAEAQAAARAAITERIKVEAARVRTWVGLILLDSELKGRQVGDVGLLVLEYLVGEFVPSGLSGTQQAESMVAAQAARLRDAYERGEVIP